MDSNGTYGIYVYPNRSHADQTVLLLTHSLSRCRFISPWGIFERCSQEIGLLSPTASRWTRGAADSVKNAGKVGSRRASGLALRHLPRTYTSQHPSISSKKKSLLLSLRADQSLLHPYRMRGILRHAAICKPELCK